MGALVVIEILVWLKLKRKYMSDFKIRVSSVKSWLGKPVVFLFSFFLCYTVFASVDNPSEDESFCRATGEKQIQQTLQKAHDKFKGVHKGENANYIPALAEVNSNLFGLSIVTVDGKIYEVGDTNHLFTIQSISKVFMLAAALQEFGVEAIYEKIGADSSGQKFNSVIAIELSQSRTGNPLINAGAMATTSLVAGSERLSSSSREDKWSSILTMV